MPDEMNTDEKFDGINQRLDDLFSAIKGDNFGNPGYRQRIEHNERTLIDHERTMNRIDKRFDKIYQRVIGIAIGVTIASSAVGFAIKRAVVPAKAVPIVTHIAPVPLSTMHVQPAVPLDTVSADSTKKKRHAKK
jgi:hypothetical protein